MAASSAVAGSSKESESSMFKSINPDSFDWTAYEGTYKGWTLITRLYHIPTLIASSEKYQSPQTIALAKQALRRVIPKIKDQTWDSALYLKATALLDDFNHPERLSTKLKKIPRQSAVVKGEGNGTSLGDTGSNLQEGEGVTGGSALDAESPEKEGSDEDEKMEAEDAEGEGEEEGSEDGLDVSEEATKNAEVDVEWIANVREMEKREYGRLDVELRGYMSNLIKESIRLTYLALAQLSIKAGKPAEALRSYQAAREYSSSPAHHVDLGLGILDVCLAFNLPTSLPGHISKLEAAVDRAYPPTTNTTRSGDQASMTAADMLESRLREARAQSVRRTAGVKIRVAKGLVGLISKNWEMAGRELGEIGEEGGLGDWEGQAISTPDIALITGLCTIATSTRDRIRRVLLDRTSFRSAVSDDQGWIIDLVRAFMEAKYGEVSAILTKIESTLILNPFLSAHSRSIVELIATRAITQYVNPFSTVKIEEMAKTFNKKAEDVLLDVEYLVEQGQIKGRINLIDGILEMTQRNERQAMFKNAMETGKRTTDATKAALLRMRLQEAGIVVDPRPANETGGMRLGSTDNYEMLPEMEGVGSLDDMQAVS